jgi:hypothetical protein
LQFPSLGGAGGGGGGDSAGSSIGAAIGKIGGTILGGPIGGGIGDALGSIFGGLFAQGGTVDASQGIDRLLGLGYIVGALHQRDFGGTPETLQKASALAAKILHPSQQQPQQRMAEGGTVEQAIARAMGLGDPTNAPNVASSNQIKGEAPPLSGNGLSTSTNIGSPTGMLGLQENANSGDTQSQALMNRIYASQQPQQVTQQPTGYMRGFAVGGLPDGPPDAQQDQQPPPLKPGQTFVGDGSVKGPGGPTDDAIPAKLSNGEFVMSAPAVKFFGVDKLNKMNEQGKQGYMQALGQVQANQQGGQPPQGPGQQLPPTPGAAPPSQQPPQMQMPPSGPSGPPGGMKKGGMMSTRNTTGYCGI